MADLQIVDIGTTKTDSTINADGDYLAADTTAGATYKALVDDFVLAALAQTASTVAIAADVNVDSGTLFVDVSANNVGIGTTSPQVKTHISVGSHGTFQSTFGVALAVESSAQARIGIFTPNTGAGILSFGDPQDHDIGMLIYDHSNNAMQMYVNAAERMRIDSSGNVGIGTTALTAKLQVNGSIAIVDGMTAPSTISGYAVIYVDSSDGDLKVKFGNGTVKTIVTDT